jgi:predicted site-specific integrase-resolvase
MQTKAMKYNLRDAASLIGVAPITLRRWLLSHKVREVARDRNGWRFFTKQDLVRIKRYASKVTRPPKE